MTLRRSAARATALAVGLAPLLVACGEAPWDAERSLPPSAVGAERALAEQAQAARHFGVPLELTDTQGLVYRLVPPGTFRMGSPPEEPGRAPDEAAYVVSLPVPYFLQQAEVTWEQIGRWRPDLAARAGGEPGSHPARGLTHAEATAFAAWLTAQDRHLFHRLPSEAEWERACRAGDPGRWGTGVAEAEATAPEPGSRPVGEGPANAWGLRGMHGNAAEWCRTWYAPYPTWKSDLPTGPHDGETRVVRGGSYVGPPLERRSAARGQLAPEERDVRVGLRLLVEVGYGVPGLGVHRVQVQTYDGDWGDEGRRPRPGYGLRVVSVPERLTARQEDRHIRWIDLDGPSPQTLTMLPGRYYFQAWHVVDGAVVRGIERKCTIPEDLPEIRVELPPGAAQPER